MRALCLSENLPPEVIQSIRVSLNFHEFSTEGIASESELAAYRGEVPACIFAHAENLNAIQIARQKFPKAYIGGILLRPLRRVDPEVVTKLDINAIIASDHKRVDLSHLLAILSRVKNPNTPDLSGYIFNTANPWLQFEISNHENKESCLTQIRHRIAALGQDFGAQKFQWFANNLSMVCDEMLLTAISFSLGGTSGLGDRYELTSNRNVACSLAFDGRLIIRVQDKVGKLTRKDLFQVLTRPAYQDNAQPFDHVPWVGLRFAYEHSDLMVIRVAEGRFTDYMTMLSVDGFPSMRKSRLRSLHHFQV